MRFKIWGDGSGLRPARRLNREHVESVVLGALDGSVTGPAPDLPRRRLLRLGLVVAVLAILSGGAWLTIGKDTGDGQARRQDCTRDRRQHHQTEHGMREIYT